MDRFVFAPTEVFQDDRLSKIQLRVLLGLFSFRDKSSNVVFPKRERLVERVGYCDAVISRATTGLVGLGWLKKVGNGGRSSPCRYEILCPDLAKTVTESVRVNNAETVTESVTKTVTDSVRGKELTNELKEKNKQKRKFLGVEFGCLSDCISLSVASAFVEHRKKLKAPLTQHAFELAMLEAEKAPSIGMSPDDAINATIAAGWKGVNLDWLRPRSMSAGNKTNFRRLSVVERVRQANGLPLDEWANQT